MTKDKALEMALELIIKINKEGWMLADFEPEMYACITAIKEALAQRVVQVKPWEFNMMTQGKEDITGEPIAWSQWPNKEHNV
jgi:hypothetical protein